jgi:hypothetical protein
LDSPDSPILSWQVHPARERWKTALAVATVLALAAWLSAQIMEQTGWGVFALCVLVVGCNRFFFPTRYELTNEGITARFPLRTVSYRWPEIRRFMYDETGGFLSPRSKSSFLDEYRGISLLFPLDSVRIIQTIRRELPAEAVVREVLQKPALPKEGQTPCGG